MNLVNNLEMSVTGIKTNKLRSTLTMLGIIIGVAAVIIMIAVGQGVNSRVTSQIASMGSNLLMVYAGAGQGAVRGSSGSVNTLTLNDAKAIAQIDSAQYVAPEQSSSATIAYNNQTWTSTYDGTTPDLLSIKNWTISSGSFITDEDVDNVSPVAVLGSTVVENLYSSGTDPIGTKIRIGGQSFTVVGTLASKGSSSVGQDQDDVVYIPITTAQIKLLGSKSVRLIDVQVDTAENISTVQSNIETLLRQRHRLADTASDDFNVRNMESVLETVESTSATLTFFLAGVAAISLLVGGIGIMNIMLVSVTERTREIGLRMAVGANESDIRNQFLVEALVLCLAGGIIGIILGVAGSKIIAKVASMSMSITPYSIILSAGFSAAIGVFFGYYPAKKAAGLDPIEALRSEA